MILSNVISSISYCTIFFEAPKNSQSEKSILDYRYRNQCLLYIVEIRPDIRQKVFARFQNTDFVLGRLILILITEIDI